MMQIPWYTIGLGLFISILAVVLIRRLSGEKRLDEDVEKFQTFLDKIRQTYGLQPIEARNQFKSPLLELYGEIGSLQVDIEVGWCQDIPFTRITVDFPKLEQGLSISQRRRSDIIHSLLLRRRIETGDDEFDQVFFVSSQRPRRAKAFLSEPFRSQLKILHQYSDKIQIGDTSIFVYIDDARELENLSKCVRKAIDLGDRFERSGRLISSIEKMPDLHEYERGTG